MINWHRLFGIALTEFFNGSPFVVELEKDLSQKKQLLDIVIIRRTEGQWDHPLPDGFDNLADHNLISYKSLREPFDDWTLKELTGHYVNYRKQVSPSLNDLLPEDQFRLYGICTRFPSHLTGQVDMYRVLGGVYDIYRGSDRIRLIVLSEIQDARQNRIWELFSTRPDHIQVAAQEFQARYGEASTILNQLFRYYQMEGLPMPYTMEDFKRDAKEEFLKSLTPEERLKGLPAEERLKGLPPEERLKGLPSDELLKRLSVGDIQAYLKKLLDHSDSGSSEKS
ncbi:MAG: hypothetical protein HY774_08245 [Acidobacteria bacterium]|nr:hypothetical protein [Acidobacteriota bacterium]